jgi:uncharacterized protein (DUF1501 family)
MSDPERTNLPGLSRRGFLGGGLAAGLWLATGGHLRAAPQAPARHCIVLWLNGGPSQLETFDPKPGTVTGGATRAIETRVKGLRFAEYLPGLAERADRLAVIRSLSSREGDHTRARYLLHTGYTPSNTIRHPTWGSVISAETRAGAGRADVPSFVTLGGDEVGPGYLGVSHAAYVVRGGDAGPLAPSKGLTPARRRSRRELLRVFEEPFARDAGLDPGAAGAGSARTDAYGRATTLLQGPLRGALAVGRESEVTRARYGQHPYGRAVLAARRLVEAGVRCVEVRLDGWDDHEDLWGRLPERCRGLDRAFAALLDDLAERELLSRTLVVCMGEFGRTPDINGRGGRDHYPRAFPAVLAGGGVRTGAVIGATSPDGREVADRPVGVADLFATLATMQGFDPKARRFAGERPVTLVNEGQAVRELLPV